MRFKFWILLLLCASFNAAFGQANKIDPAKQVRWPAVTGSGAPTAPTWPCAAANYGQPYTDTTNNVQYTCSASGWIASSGQLSGQTPNCAPKAATTTSSTSSLPVCDDGTTTTLSHPVVISGGATISGGSGSPVTIQANKTPVPTAGSATLGTDASGNLIESDNGGTAGRVCTTTNGQNCGGGSSATQYPLAAYTAGTGPYTAAPFNATTDATGNNITIPGIATSAQLFTDATNYGPVSSGSGLYAAHSMSCAQSTLPSDPGGTVSSGCFSIPTDEDWYPGYSYGAQSLGPTGWWDHAVIGSGLVSSYSAGIHEGLNLSGTWTGAGDFNGIDLNAYIKPAWITNSDEGVHMMTWHDNEVGAVHATVTSTASGNTQIYMSGSNQLVGLLSPLIDTTQGTSVTLSSVNTVGQTFPGGGALATATISPTATASIQGTLGANVVVPRTVNNTTGELSQAVISGLTVNTPSDLSTSPAIIEVLDPEHPEVVLPTAYGTFSGGTQTITATFRFSHPSGTTFCAGGLVGHYIEYATHGGDDYVFPIYCSASTSSIWVGQQVPATFSGGFIANGTVTMYPGGDIVGVTNPTSGIPGAGYARIMPPPTGAFTTGDSVENTNNVSALNHLDFFVQDANNPYAETIMEDEQWKGLAGGFTYLSGGRLFTNNRVSTDYFGAGGSYMAPNVTYALGPVADGLVLDKAPLSNNGNYGDRCGGAVVCVANGLDSSAIATTYDWFRDATYNTWMRFDKSDYSLNFTVNNGGGAFRVNGSQVCVAGSSVPGCGTATASGTPGVMASFTGASTLGNGYIDYQITAPASDSLYMQKPIQTSWVGGPNYDAGQLFLSGDWHSAGTGVTYIALNGYNYPSSPGDGASQIVFHPISGAATVMDGSYTGHHAGFWGFGYAANAIVPFQLSVTGGSGFGCTGTSCTATIDGSGNSVFPTVNGIALTTGGSATAYLDGTGHYSTPTGAVSSVSNSDGTLTISPTTGAVVGSLNLGHANTWTALQTFNSNIVTPVVTLNGGGDGTNPPIYFRSTAPIGFNPAGNIGMWLDSNTVLHSNANFTSPNFELPSAGVLSWNSDSGLSRDAAGVIDVGNGTAGDKSGTINATTYGAGTLANGMVATTQSSGDNSTKVATTAYVDAAISGGTPHAQYSWHIPTVFTTATVVSAIYYIPTTATSASFHAVVDLTGSPTCTTWPTYVILDLGTSATTAYSSATTLATVTTSAAGAATGSGTYTFTAGHYIGIGVTDTAACSVWPFADTTLVY